MTQKEDIKNAIDAMKKGGVILYPTDTVWGLGCDATNAEAVAKIYKIKDRDDSKALICLADSVDRVQRYVRDVPSVAKSAHISALSSPSPKKPSCAAVMVISILPIIRALNGFV